MTLTVARRIPLVGRPHLLAKAAQLLQAGGVHLLYVEGDGGSGKTAQLEAVLERARAEAAEGRVPVHVAQQVVDLDECENHAPEGLLRRIVAVLGPHLFVQSCSAMKRLDAARTAGNLDRAHAEWEALSGSFLKELAGLAADGLVLALDTLEALEGERAPALAEAGEPDRLFHAGAWLFDVFFPALGGTALILLAGRPGSTGERLRRLPQRWPHVRVTTLALDALGEEGTAEYLEAVARREAERGDGDAATRLREFATERAGVVHLLSGGRPVTVALIAELVAEGRTLPACFGRRVENLQGQGVAVWWPEIAHVLVSYLLEIPTPLGETLLALAWLGMGGTPSLLARVMNLTGREGQLDVGAAAECLEQVAGLALVKVRPGDGRVSLQEPVAELLETYVLPLCSQEERDRVYGAIVQDYDAVVAGLEEALDRSPLGQPLLQARLRQAYLEQMHYALCHRPPLGLAIYACLADGALGGGDHETGARLDAELARTVRAVTESGFSPDLDPRQVEIELAVRRAMRLLDLQDGAPAVLGRLAVVQKQWATLLASQPLLRAQIQLFQAVALLRRGAAGDWAEARALLQGVQRAAGAVLRSAPLPAAGRGLTWWASLWSTTFRAAVIVGAHWRARALKATASRYQGVVDRLQGRYPTAARHFQASAALQRRLATVELGPALADLAGTMALLGQFESARLVADEAVRWAHWGGKGDSLAWALNARALVEILEDHPTAALTLCEQALQAAAGNPAPRLQGLLALNRARAHQLLWATGAGAQSPEQQEGLQAANLAVHLLQDNPSEQVAALMERGNLYRAMARDESSAGAAAQGRPPAGRWRQAGEEDLTHAAELSAAAGLLDQQAGAWVNLAWLWYDSGRLGDAERALQQATASVPPSYTLPVPPAPRPTASERDRLSGEGACLPFWSILGSVELLKAWIILAQAEADSAQGSEEQRLHEAVRLMSLSLAYEQQVAADTSALRRAEESIYHRILRDHLDVAALQQHACQVATEEGWPLPTRLQRFLERTFGPGELWI